MHFQCLKIWLGVPNIKTGQHRKAACERNSCCPNQTELYENWGCSFFLVV